MGQCPDAPRYQNLGARGPFCINVSPVETKTPLGCRCPFRPRRAVTDGAGQIAGVGFDWANMYVPLVRKVRAIHSKGIPQAQTGQDSTGKRSRTHFFRQPVPAARERVSCNPQPDRPVDCPRQAKVERLFLNRGRARPAVYRERLLFPAVKTAFHDRSTFQKFHWQSAS